MNKRFIVCYSIIFFVGLQGLSAQHDNQEAYKQENNQPTYFIEVTDHQGHPLKGAIITVKSAPGMFYTDQEGKLILSAHLPNPVFIIQYPGYRSREIYADRSQLCIQLHAIRQTWDDQVTLPHGSAARKELTGAVHSISAGELAQQPVSNALSGMIGKVPGLLITPANGMPGSDYQVTIRGKNSILNGSNPLYVVDGIPIVSTSLAWNLNDNINSPVLGLGANGSSSPLNSIHTAAIKSIEVLKDADATALYGSQGGNGVILITTQKPDYGSHMDVRVYSGIGRATRRIPYLNTTQYLQMRREALANDGKIPGPKDYDLTLWDTTRYTDWQQAMIGNTASIVDATVNFQIGTPTTGGLLGFNYRQETTVYPAYFNNEKLSFLYSGHAATPYQKIRITYMAQYVRDRQNLPQANLITYAAAPPNSPALYRPVSATADEMVLNWEQGTFNNPYAAMLRTYYGNTRNLILHLQPSFQLSRDWQLKADLGYNYLDLQEIQANPIASIKPYPDPITPGYTYFANSRVKNWMLGPELSYHKKTGESQFDFLAGASWQIGDWKQEGFLATGYVSDSNLREMIAASKVEALPSSNQIESRINAQFMRGGYTFMDRYIIHGTLRRDNIYHSMLLSQDGPVPAQWSGIYGAVGAGWIFSKERWLSRQSFLSFGKVRASYGQVGNDQPLNYRFTTDSLQLRQEHTQKVDIALDLGFWQDKVLLNATYYHNTSAIKDNMGTRIRNTGVEFAFSSANIGHQHFSWYTNFDITFPQNKLLTFSGLENSVYRYFYSVGSPINILKGAQATGVDPATGLYQFKDLDGDGQLTFPGDYTHASRIGPTMYGGLQNSLQYKNWQLDIHFLFVKQDHFNYLYQPTTPGPGLIAQNQPATVLDRWQKLGDQTNIQKFTQEFGTAAANSFQSLLVSDQAVTDASFIRLKSLSLSYQFSAKWMQRLQMSSARLFIQGQNLWTLTRYKGRDPETPSMGEIYPQLKTCIAGFKMNF